MSRHADPQPLALGLYFGCDCARRTTVFRRGGGGFPVPDSPLEIVVSLLVLAFLIWLIHRLLTS